MASDVVLNFHASKKYKIGCLTADILCVKELDEMDGYYILVIYLITFFRANVLLGVSQSSISAISFLYSIPIRY